MATERLSFRLAIAFRHVRLLRVNYSMQLPCKFVRYDADAATHLYRSYPGATSKIMAYSLVKINQMTQTEFVAALGSVFENTPDIAKQSWQQRPFADVNHLHQTMASMVKQMSQIAQLELLRAHPDLGSKAKMAPASIQEQVSVGLTCLNAEEYSQFQSLNKRYRAKFNFPFIMAVKGQTKETILAAFTNRLLNSPVVEQQQALIEINKIAHFRLDELID